MVVRSRTLLFRRARKQPMTGLSEKLLLAASIAGCKVRGEELVSGHISTFFVGVRAFSTSLMLIVRHVHEAVLPFG